MRKNMTSNNFTILLEVKDLITEINKGEQLPPKDKNEKTYNPFDSLRRLSIIDSKK